MWRPRWRKSQAFSGHPAYGFIFLGGHSSLEGTGKVPFPGRARAEWAKLVPQTSPSGWEPLLGGLRALPVTYSTGEQVRSGESGEQLQEEGAGLEAGPRGEGQGLGWSRGRGAGPRLRASGKAGAWAGQRRGAGLGTHRGLQAFSQSSGLGLAVGPEAAFLRELVGHGGSGERRL